ncbi:hypothetical protein [Tsukamurella tyrosinosolvens]|uniref:hypothetical protein n=1 Tax=Tsukamurella tyrosinosolvens TaxID=57704 RepID=UPI0007B1D140|nr:hypothetical protein [Tsukamurella tyrosinosolvens]KZL96947.1 hypothetical protein AXX05_15815 [Tsukamurella tyrosinosolvens]
MTQYRLAALEWWQEVDHTTVCDACGARGERQVETIRHRQGDVVDVDGAEEARLLAAGALAPLEDEPAEDSDDDASGSDGDGGADTPPADTDTGDQPAEAPDTDGPVGTVESGLISAEVEKPKKAAPVDDWRAYAVAQGLDAEAVAKMSKVDLIAKVGG